MHLSASGGHTAICQYLIEVAKADVNRSSLNKVTPLHIAAENGHTKTCELLLAHGAKIYQASNGGTPLHFAAETGHLETCQFLVEVGKADVNQATQDGWTPLHLAANNGHTRTCQFLVEVGKANVNQATQDGWTPLHSAVKNDHTEVARILIKGLIQQGYSLETSEKTSLQYACEYKLDPTLISIHLLKQKQDASYVNQLSSSSGQGALHYALTPFLEGPPISRFVVVSFLRIHTVGQNKTFPKCLDKIILQYCSYTIWREKAINLLLNNGADPSKIDKDGITPLYYAIKHGYIGVCRQLWRFMTAGKENPHLRNHLLSIAEKEGHQEVINFFKNMKEPGLASL